MIVSCCRLVIGVNCALPPREHVQFDLPATSSLTGVSTCPDLSCCCWVAPPAMHCRWPEAGQSASGWYPRNPSWFDKFPVGQERLPKGFPPLLTPRQTFPGCPLDCCDAQNRYGTSWPALYQECPSKTRGVVAFARAEGLCGEFGTSSVQSVVSRPLEVRHASHRPGSSREVRLSVLETIYERISAVEFAQNITFGFLVKTRLPYFSLFTLIYYNYGVHMRFRLSPRSTTLNCYKFEFSGNFLWFCGFGKQQRL